MRSGGRRLLFFPLHIFVVVASVGHLHRRASQSTPEKEYAFEMACSTVRYGPGVTQEVGMDVQNLGITKLCVFTDQNVSLLLCIISLLQAHDSAYQIGPELLSMPPQCNTLALQVSCQQADLNLF